MFLFDCTLFYRVKSCEHNAFSSTELMLKYTQNHILLDHWLATSLCPSFWLSLSCLCTSWGASSWDSKDCFGSWLDSVCTTCLRHPLCHLPHHIIFCVRWTCTSHGRNKILITIKNKPGCFLSISDMYL
jgi:hypothetical protein